MWGIGAVTAAHHRIPVHALARVGAAIFHNSLPMEKRRAGGGRARVRVRLTRAQAPHLFGCDLARQAE
jgi:hypothetical protein